jgi:hypothetical protein
MRKVTEPNLRRAKLGALVALTLALALVLPLMLAASAVALAWRSPLLIGNRLLIVRGYKYLSTSVRGTAHGTRPGRIYPEVNVWIPGFDREWVVGDFAIFWNGQ